MMNTPIRPTRYPREWIPRQGEALGATTLRLPLWELASAFVVWWLQRVLRHVQRGQNTGRPEDLLQDEKLGPQARSLEEWFGDYPARVPRLDGDSAGGFATLAQAAEDLALEDGRWKDDASELDRPEEEARRELAQRIERLTRRALLECGAEAARALLEQLRQQWEGVLPELTEDLILPAGKVQELRDAALSLRAFARPRSFWRLLLRWFPRLSPRWWLEENKVNRVRRRLLPLLQQAARLRHDNERRKRRLRVVEDLLGRPGAPGVLDRAVHTVEAQRAFLARLAPARAPRKEETTWPDEILLLRGLDTVLDRARRRTLLHLYVEAAQRAGCTPRALAETLTLQGLAVGARRYRPGAWSSLPRRKVQRALVRTVAAYLGVDPRAELNIARPRTAFEHIAAITPLHPELAGLLAAVLPAWVRQAQPYADIAPVPGAAPVVLGMLLCYPPDRGSWEERLRSRVQLVRPATADEDAYSTGHPHVAVLLHHGQSLALGALRALPGWLSQVHQLRRAGRQELLYDPADSPEFRLLARRPEDSQDAMDLFALGRKAGVIVPLPSGRKGAENGPVEAAQGQSVGYTLSRPHPLLTPLFAPEVREREWQSPQVFHALVQRDRFVQFLERTFPELDLRASLRWLRQEEDPQLVASALEKLCILESRGQGRLFRLRCEPGAVGMPAQLYRKRPGPLRGLTELEFSDELQRNDLLYTVVAWGIVEAVELGALSSGELTAYLRELLPGRGLP